MQLLRVSRRKNQRFFPCGAFRSRVVHDCSSKCPNSLKTSSPALKNSWLCAWLCTNSVAHPLTLIFQNSLTAGTFSTQWKRANIVPIYKRNDKQIVSNYRQVSLLPICSKIFKKLIFNEIFKFFEDKNLLSKHQPGFRPGDSCIYQLLAITHDIFSSFDCNASLETRGVFFDISKAFDRVSHDGLLFKLKQNGVNGNLFQLITSFLSGNFKEFYSLVKHQIGKLFK